MSASKRKHSLTDDGKVIHLSVSQLNTYSQCSEQWYLQKIAKAPQAPTAWLPHGTAFHAAVEAWENSERRLSDADVHLIGYEHYVEEANAMVEEFPEPSTWLTGSPRIDGFQDLERREEILKFQIQQYLDHARSEMDYWEVVESERPFETELGGIKVVGFIDQIIKLKGDGSYVVADLKSGTKLPASPVQLATYAVALNRELDLGVELGEWVQPGRPASGRYKEKPLKRQMVDLTEEPGAQLENLERFFYAVAQGIEAKSFVPNAGDHCRVCPVQQWCSGVGHLGSSQQYPRPVPIKIGESPWGDG